MDCVLLLFQRRLQPVKPDAVVASPKPSWQDSLKVITYGGMHSNINNIIPLYPVSLHIFCVIINNLTGFHLSKKDIYVHISPPKNYRDFSFIFS